MDRQKKFLLFGAAWVSAILLTWFLYANAVAPREEARSSVVVATHDMPLGTLLRPTDVKMVKYPDRDIPKGVLFQAKDAWNKVLLVPMNSNEPVLLGKLSAITATEGVSATIPAGYRAVSVPITDVSGVAGLIQPSSKVDVLFTRPGSMAEATTSTILQNVRVISTGRQTQTGQAVDPRAPKSPVITLVLTPADAQKLELAKNEGKISLSLRNPLDSSESADTGPVTTEVLDPMISARLARARKGRTTNVARANLDDPKVWQDLTGEKKVIDAEKAAREAEEARRKKEAERPRVVVDVYRGDKHVQELFK
ncbi:MAG TPA: Flp pilus assembly protein CpaB [Candidatus Acidoferrales bacterium]|jgi:pilus assembly protein CpaB|nr:Flp pilus assembly protein CpaB [Candidatus Acidoferrales bacterium]